MSRPKSFVPHQLVELLRKVATPARVLQRGHIFLLLYSAGLTYLAFWAAQLLTREGFAYLASLDSDTLPAGSWAPLLGLAWAALCWLSTIPVMLTAFTLPVRSLWVQGRVDLVGLLEQTPLSITNTIRCLVLSVRQVFVLLLPGIAMLFLYSNFVTELENRQTYLLYTAGCIAVFLGSAYKALPVLLSVYIMLCAQSAPLDSVLWSSGLFSQKRKHIVLIVFPSLVVLAAILRQIQRLPLSPESVILCGELWLLFGFWYLNTQLAVLTLETLTALAAQQPPQAPPGNQGLPADFQVTKVEVQR